MAAVSFTAFRQTESFPHLSQNLEGCVRRMITDASFILPEINDYKITIGDLPSALISPIWAERKVHSHMKALLSTPVHHVVPSADHSERVQRGMN